MQLLRCEIVDAMNCVDQRISNLLESARVPGTSLFSADNVAKLLAFDKSELAAITGVHHNTLRSHPESKRVQDGLRTLMQVVTSVLAIQPDVTKAVFLVKNEPIPLFNYRTLMQLIEQGRARDAIDYLSAAESGFSG